MTPLASFIVGFAAGFAVAIPLIFWTLDQRILKETNRGLEL